MHKPYRRFEVLLPLKFNDGKPVPDDLIADTFVDVPDLAANRQFFVEFKQRAKTRFQQIDLLVTTYPLDLL